MIASADESAFEELTDSFSKLIELVEREHQRIADLETTVTQLRQDLAKEIKCRQALSRRLDTAETAA